MYNQPNTYIHMNTNFYDSACKFQIRDINKQGRSQKWPKEGVLRVRKRCGYAPERRYVGVLVK